MSARLDSLLAEHDEAEARRAELVAKYQRGEVSVYRYDESIADLDEEAYGILGALVEAMRSESVVTDLDAAATAYRKYIEWANNCDDDDLENLDEHLYAVVTKLGEAVTAFTSRPAEVLAPSIPEVHAGQVRLTAATWLTPEGAEELARNLLDAAWAARNCNR
ncbi:hypothetical protein [Kribbella sindirgiensis]|uniref:Uncharacterized protein n=1 Tax=Kribbella sindirgiensis TaxID=1124744 RepID=A0A4R0I511_9ACTN|nr:hypothetical protein [Kribbella sindirgiensis]TCC19943.1 hypothetical protein E0H50_37570 [Kribbella sindirgiensis]